MIRPLRTPPERLYNLYLSNYWAHVAKRQLEKLIGEKSSEIPQPILQELQIILQYFKIVSDVEKRE